MLSLQRRLASQPLQSHPLPAEPPTLVGQQTVPLKLTPGLLRRPNSTTTSSRAPGRYFAFGSAPLPPAGPISVLLIPRLWAPEGQGEERTAA